MSKDKNFKRRNRFLRPVQGIQQNAFEILNSNSVQKELTYQQALSILFRHRQLVQEGEIHPNNVNVKDKQRQIDDCYRLRAEEIFQLSSQTT